MVTLKLIDVLNLNAGLTSLTNFITENKKSIKFEFSYKISRLLLKLKDEVEAYSNANQLVLFKYSLQDKDRQVFKSVEDKMSYESEVKEMLQKEISFDIKKFKLSDLKPLNPTPDILVLLDSYIEIDEDIKPD